MISPVALMLPPATHTPNSGLKGTGRAVTSGVKAGARAPGVVRNGFTRQGPAGVTTRSWTQAAHLTLRW